METNNIECIICYTDNIENVCVLKCHHRYCSECIINYLIKYNNNSCPLCKFILFKNPRLNTQLIIDDHINENFFQEVHLSTYSEILIFITKLFRLIFEPNKEEIVYRLIGNFTISLFQIVYLTNFRGSIDDKDLCLTPLIQCMYNFILPFIILIPSISIFKIQSFKIDFLFIHLIFTFNLILTTINFGFGFDYFNLPCDKHNFLNKILFLTTLYYQIPCIIASLIIKIFNIHINN